LIEETERQREETMKKCEQEVSRLEFEKGVHLSLIDILYESQG
jgi:hypothetical protein